MVQWWTGNGWVFRFLSAEVVLLFLCLVSGTLAYSFIAAL